MTHRIGIEEIEIFCAAYDYDANEILDELDISIDEVVSILTKLGYVALPSWVDLYNILDNKDNSYEEEDYE